MLGIYDDYSCSAHIKVCLHCKCLSESSLTFVGGVGVREGLVGTLAHELPAARLPVVRALDDLVVVLSQRLRELYLLNRSVKAAYVQVTFRLR